MLSNLILAALLGADPTAALGGEAPPSLPVAAAAVGNHEVIQERFPNGDVQVQREVTQDERQNYVNHGVWVQYNEKGLEIARGEFVMGKRQGPWFRQFPGVRDLNVPLSPSAAQFQGPLLSHATFNEGKINGEWTITDARDRLVMCLAYQDGKRHGSCTWWHSNGTKWREAQYREGLLDGEANEWSPQQKVVRTDTYVGGRLLRPTNDFYSPGVKKLEAQYLGPVGSVEQGDDWWTATSRLPSPAEGDAAKVVLHGHWISWHQNRQKASEGQYEEGQPEGAFTWWYSNGQKASEGCYERGQAVGPWTWWHSNGQKEMQGAFVAGSQSGNWIWWSADGQVVKCETLDERVPSVALSPTPGEDVPTLRPEGEARRQAAPASGIKRR